MCIRDSSTCADLSPPPEHDSRQLRELIHEIRNAFDQAIEHVRSDMRDEIRQSLNEYLSQLDAAVARYEDAIGGDPVWRLRENEFAIYFAALDKWQYLGRRVARVSNGGWNHVEPLWSEIRDTIEHRERELTFQTTSDVAEICKQLYWMAERPEGNFKHLFLVRDARRGRLGQLDDISRLLRTTEDKIYTKLYKSRAVVDREEAAYQKRAEEWKRLYSGQFIAVHRGEVIASQRGYSGMLEQLHEYQTVHGPISAYVIQVGAPLLDCQPAAPKSSETIAFADN